MSKRLFVLAWSILLLGGSASLFAAPVGVFHEFADVGTEGDPFAPGVIVEIAPVMKNGAPVDQYLMFANGTGMGGGEDHMYYAYRNVTGSIRLSADLEIVDSDSLWSMVGPMFRETLDPGSVNYVALLSRGNRNRFQWRDTTGGDSSSDFNNVNGAIRHGIQRVVSNGYTVIQRLIDTGSGWEVHGQALASSLPDAIMLGIAATGHNRRPYNPVGVFRLTDVLYEENVELIAITTIGGDLKGAECPDVSGFAIKNVVAGAGSDLNGDRYLVAFPKAEWLIENENLSGIPAASVGVRAEEFVNLHDMGGRGVFDNDQSFPGMDPFEQPTANPAGGDDENHFATEATGCIELTVGLHVIGGHADDGLEIWVGGVLIGQSAGRNDNSDFAFLVEQTGVYSFRALSYEQDGGADMEVWYTLADGSRVLLNDTANGSPAVHIPEPATLLLLGLGGLALLRKGRIT